MAKAILVIDVPKDCEHCELMADYAEDWSRCSITNIPIRDGKAKKDCPLKSMPKKLHVDANRIEDVMSSEFDIDKLTLKIQLDTDKLFTLGWNACLEELEKC